MREILFRGKRKDGGEWIYGEDVEGWTPTRRARIAGYRSEVIGNIHDNPKLLEAE